MAGIREEIKARIIEAGKTMSEVAQALTEKKGQKITLQNLSNKLGRETITYKEVKEIAEVLGYEIKWVKK